MARRRTKKRRTQSGISKKKTTVTKSSVEKVDDTKKKHSMLMHKYESDIRKASHMASYSEKAEADAMKAMKQVSRYSKRKFG